MPARPPLVPLVVILVSLVAFTVLAAGAGAGMMGGWMDDWHGRMMGGRGSDPDDVAAVSGVTDVRIEDFAFDPANIIVEPGTTVTWTNEDGVEHTVTSTDGGPLDSPRFGRGGTYSYTFDVPGAYAYYCEPHPNMKGLVTVRDADG